MRGISHPVRRLHILSCILALATSATTAYSSLAADLRLPRIFGDHMVLRRDKLVRVWGWAGPGTSVTVAFAGQTQTTTVAADGTWLLELKPMAVSAEGRELIASCGTSKVTIKDVRSVTYGSAAGRATWNMGWRA
jgi:sialate O-acetylesterase